MKINIIENKNQYDLYYKNNLKKFEERYLQTLEIEKNNPDQNQKFSLKGFSITANKEVDFLVDWLYSDGTNINWRERLVCPKTNLCNRLRASYHLILNALQTTQNENIYITEQLTPFYKFLKKKIKSIVGSEFISSDKTPGRKYNFIRHEDLTNLSFNDNALDKIFSFDVLEHIPDYKSALRECLRVLRPGGQVLFSFPFDTSRYDNLVRAKINNGKIEYLVEPEYHGDPINKDGCLSYYTFGWELLDQMRSIGYRNVRALCYWSKEYGYLGPDQISFTAEK